MTESTTLVGGLLSQMLSHSPYTYFLARHVSLVGVSVGPVVMLLNLDAQSGEVSLHVCDEPDHAGPLFWVECDLSSLDPR